MFRFLRDLKLNIKISILGAGSVLITAGALVALAVWQSGQYNELAQREVDRLLDADLDHITQGAYNLVRTEDEAVKEQLSKNLNVMRHILAARGGVCISREMVDWTAVNQFTGRSVKVRLPGMLVGGKWIGQNSHPAVRTPVVDEVERVVGETATIFQRMDERGDMLRVATNVRDSRGRRAIGTYIPAVNDDGSPNPVVAAVLEGKTYHGRAFVVNAWYLTAYEPLRDGAGNLVGMIYTGIKQKSVEMRIRHAIQQIKVGKTGYVYVLGGKGEDRGRYIISWKGERDDENIWDSRDSDGRYVVQEIIRKATVLKPGEMATERYRWQNPGETEPRWKVARLAYYAPWDWVIGVGVHEDEIHTYRAILSGGRNRMTRIMGAAGITITLLIGLLGVFIAWTITRHIRQMTRAAEIIIGGDLNQVVDAASRDEVGTLARTFNMMTERLRETMAGLRVSEEKYRSIFENSVEGIFRSTPDGRFLNINPAGVRMFGYGSQQEMIDSVVDIAQELYVDPGDREKRKELLESRGVVEGFEAEMRRRDGTRIWVSINSRVVRDAAGNVLYYDNTAEDITERRRLEAQVRQSQKMEAIGTLAGGVAHDFNNILSVLMGYATLLQLELSEEDPLQEYVEHIMTSSQKAVNLTASLLTFSRLQPVRLSPVDLNETIRGTQRLLARLITEDIKLKACLTDEDLVVMADATQIDQILFNLASNARDAMPRGGTLTIKTELVELDDGFVVAHGLGDAGKYALLSVSDNGSGIDEHAKEHIFDPFFTTKGTGKGTGLGLSTVYGIVKRHGGYINVYSEKDMGTTFHIYLPAVSATSEQEVMSTQQVRGGTETVLVADDDADVRRLIRDVLTKHGYRVLEAVDGEDAVEKFRQLEKVDLLVMDSVMPGKNGREAYEAITGITPGMKVIFMSGYTRDVILEKGIEEREFDFLSKPLGANMLLKMVREVLDRA
ncbi:MAG: Blue-light-activated protein [Syntrophorhabdus sp. PtaB.Bin047]|jgi:PAS domain S-box-containing protein|nr:MAG: Blue-light-activated protein [Syntrophorhabdus sp. PtaB.Bin047]